MFHAGGIAIPVVSSGSSALTSTTSKSLAVSMACQTSAMNSHVMPCEESPECWYVPNTTNEKLLGSAPFVCSLEDDFAKVVGKATYQVGLKQGDPIVAISCN